MGWPNLKFSGLMTIRMAYYSSTPENFKKKTSSKETNFLQGNKVLQKQNPGDSKLKMIEIYNEQVRDLLVADGFSKRLEIRNSSQTGLNVPDASLLHVTKPSDVIDLMNVGQRNRAVGAIALNDRSSRSHRK
ncbi:hypothetical protein POM88_050720 [Heracleum sosnowskyi]|uniref:Kinesin motor domain-containing protein n=1 Tax=Heracleum sosnowskyi TaxID=360622 RepID=A0AAD8H0F2_9APIA|nr:hypothetical protein POM88_050720 [Heracleum sosnowskyi]